ncbi:universal stress protein [Planctomicrobium sp. SH527]|uniref:universal stress protein n=1 Tax=Planctomicrobium sp. SH527 TaxID=3448123 RepID=UPI003F5C24E0
MAKKKTILIQSAMNGSGWTEGTRAAIEQGGLLASHSLSSVYLVTMLNSDFAPLPEDVEEIPSEYSPVQDLHSAIESELADLGVKLSAAVIHESNPAVMVPPGQPAPIEVVVLGIPDLLRVQKEDQVADLFETSRNDLWLATPDAFNKEIPCFVVYDDLEPVGEQALRTAVNLAQQFQSRLLVVHALPEQPDAQSVQLAEATLMDRLFGTDFRTIDKGTRLYVTEGTPEDAILKAVQEHAASLVVTSWPNGPVMQDSIPQFAETLSEQQSSLLLVRTHDFNQPVRFDGNA